ncbi:MAG: beta-galactosidase [Victivallales bacterium]|nr:beta-galactosidase [Victivallales bacterium]
MKRVLFLSCILTLAAFASDFRVDNKALEAEFSFKGGGITQLTRKKNNAVLSFPGYTSVTERVFAQAGEVSLQETFANLEYRMVSYTRTPQHGYDVTLTTQGTACFDWLRITKTFAFPHNKENFTVLYTLKNLDSKPHFAGMWLKTFFALYDEAGSSNRIMQPRNGELTEITHPGSATHDEWSPTPGLSLVSIGGKESNQGIVATLPPTVCAGFYSWCSARHGSTLNTFEMITREMELPAKGEISFLATFTVSDNAAELARRLAKGPEYKITESQGREASCIPGTPAYRPYKAIKTGVFGDFSSYVDFVIPRQFNESIRSAILPPDADPARVAVYELCNKRVDRDRPLPSTVKTLPDGTKRLLFKVPSMGGHGHLYTSIDENGVAFDKFNGLNPRPCLGKVNMICRIVLDAEPNSAPPLDVDAPELVFNASFEKPNANNDFADGYFWHSMMLRRKLHFWEKDAGRNGTYGIRLKQEGQPTPPVFSLDFLAEPDKRYNFSAWVKCDNPDQKYAIVYVIPYDAGQKPIQSSKVYIDNASATYPWRRISKKFQLPKEAVTFSIFFQLAAAGKENTMWIDDVSLVPDDFFFVPKPALEIARETAILNGYTPLPLMETIDHSYVTPHEKWFKPAAFQAPDILYCCTIIGSNEDASRRQIVELSQRMDLNYTFIPLLLKLNGIKSKYSFGVGQALTETYLEPYSIERIKALKSLPKLALVQGIEFDKHDSNQALTNVLADLQAKGVEFVFLNCKMIPQSLTGKALKQTPPEWFLIPRMNDNKRFNRYMEVYEKAFVFDFSNAHYAMLQNFISTPPEMRNQISPAYFSRDFPFWEYPFLPLAKAIRQKAGITPDALFTAAEYKEGTLSFKLNATQETNARLRIEYKTTFRSTDATTVQDVSLKTGENSIQASTPELPGGCHIVHYKLMNTADKVIDAGALRFDTPVQSPISIEYAHKDRIYATRKPIEFSVTAENIQAGDVIQVALEDTEGRVVAKADKPAAAKADFSLTVPAPYTILYRVFANLVRGGKVQSQVMGEISLPDRKLDPTDYHAGMWGGRLLLSGMLRNLGFDLLSCEGRNDLITNGTLRNELNLGFYPLVLNLGHVANENADVYRADVPTDPVRNPCYNDPAVAKRAMEETNEKQRINNARYYAMYYNELGDEQFLGSTVCYSEHCLSEFRKYLQAQYGTVAKLNEEWGTAYASFDEATPVQKEPVANSDNLSQWLDHKMFMSSVYAHQFVGRREAIIRREVPEAQVGLSGTQVPGYGYDWAQLMKHCTCLSYYNGVQTTLVNDFALPGTLLGQWGGGYVSSATVCEIYQRSPQWSNLLKGANISWNWHGSAYNGDGSPTGNLKVYCEEFQLFKRGLGKLLLTSDKETRPVAVLYSQPSLFTAMNGGLGISDWQNTQTGWDELLRDMKFSFRFISYEELAAPDFTSRGFKAVILPMALALSDAERTNLVKAAENGAIIIADIAPGRYDSHGKRIANTVLDKLFPPNPGPIVPETMLIEQPPLKSRFHVAEPALGVMKETPCGKGRGILMNTMMTSYQAITIGGTGGELATGTSGTQELCRSIQNVLLEAMTKADIKPFATVVDAKGNTFTCQTTLRKAGDNHYFGIIPHTSLRGRGMIDHENAPTVTVTLPVKGTIYDVRQGKIIAEGNTFAVKAPIGYGQLFAILPASVEPPAITLPETVNAGDIVTCSCSAKGATSKTVYHMEVTFPDGTTSAIYTQNATFDSPEGTFSFQVPFNAAPGKWDVTITHVASGARSTRNFMVAK